MRSWFPQRITADRMTQYGQHICNASSPEWLVNEPNRHPSSLVVAVVDRDVFEQYKMTQAVLHEQLSTRQVRKTWPLIVVGHESNCRRALKAAMLLKDHGYTSVYYLSEGLTGWLSTQQVIAVDDTVRTAITVY